MASPKSRERFNLQFVRFVDHTKAQLLCVESQSLYRYNGIKTKVLPASLTSVEEIMALGVDHITIAPTLLVHLVQSPVPSSIVTKSIFDTPTREIIRPSFKSESEYRIAFTLSGRGEGERKLTQASVLHRVRLPSY